VSNTPDSPVEPVRTPYGPPAGAPPESDQVDYPPPFADERIVRDKNGFGVTSIWIGVLAVIIAVNERGATPFGLALTLSTATFATIALINVRRLGKPWVAAVTGISLAGIAVLATIWNYLLG